MPNLLFLSSLSLSITTLVLIFILIKYGKDKVHYFFLLFYVSLFAWAICSTLVSTTLNPQLSNIYWRIGCIGVTFTFVFPLHITYILTKEKIEMGLIFSYIIAIIFSLLLIKTDLILKLPNLQFYKYFLNPAVGKLYFLWFLSWFTIISFAHFFLLKSALKKGEINYNQLKIVIISFSPGFICGSFNFLIPFNVPFFQLSNFGISFYCLILMYYIFRHQFMGIEIIVRKSLLYSILIAALAGIYFCLIMAIEIFFRGIVGYRSIIMSITLASTIAIIFNPLKNKIQDLINKVFFGMTPQEIVAENELLRQEIERSERLKTASTLALGLAHEIRNPLTTIKTFAEFLPEKYKDDDFVKKFSKLIPSEVERINSIIKQLLDFSKPAPPAFHNTNVHQLINEVLTFLNSEFIKRQIEIDCPAIDVSLVAKIDAAQIKQALLNIIFNAMDAMPKGGVLHISTQAGRSSYLEIRISDTGCGIPKEDLKQIFDPFFTNKDTGSGLGLAITHQIIKNHNGSIEVESAIGKGTTFTIKLPLERSEE